MVVEPHRRLRFEQPWCRGEIRWPDGASLGQRRSAGRVENTREAEIRVLVTSFRLRHTDGVSVEAAKVGRILAGWGWQIVEVAGAFGSAAGRTAPYEPLPGLEVGSAVIARELVPELAIASDSQPAPADVVFESPLLSDPQALDHRTRRIEETLEALLRRYRPDAAIVENVFGLPLNLAFSEALYRVLFRHQIPSLLRHHDLVWQRPEYDLSLLEANLGRKVASLFPPDLPLCLHVAINRLSLEQLVERGFRTTLIYNGFAVPEDDAAYADHESEKASAKRELGLAPESVVLVQPTRAIERKGLPDALKLAARLPSLVERNVTLVVCGPAEDGYDGAMKSLIDRFCTPPARSSKPAFRLVLGQGRLPIDVVYRAADFVVFPSKWEGFGNPVVESVIWCRPLVAKRYPVLAEIERVGLVYIPWDPDPVRGIVRWLSMREEDRRQVLLHNLRCVRQNFSLQILGQRLSRAFEVLGFATPKEGEADSHNSLTIRRREPGGVR